MHVSGGWINDQSCLWNSFSSSKPDQVATVVRLFTKQLPVGFSVGNSPTSPIILQPKKVLVKTKDDARAEETARDAYESDGELSEDSYGSDSHLTEDQSQCNESYSEASGRVGDDSSIQMRQKAKLRALQAARDRKHRVASSIDEKSLDSENSKPSVNQASEPMKPKHSFMQPTAASKQKKASAARYLKNRKEPIPTTLVNCTSLSLSVISLVSTSHSITIGHLSACKES